MRRPLFWLISVVIIGAAAFWAVRRASAPAAAAGPRAGVPVVAVGVVRTDVPIYLTGLGRVQALNTVTIRSQIDGQIVNVAFREGQDVRKGDLLFQIDPGPYDAALQQALGKRAQDEAQVVNARKVLSRDEDLLGKGMVNQQDYDSQQASVAQLEALAKTDDATVADARLKLAYTHIASPIDGRVGLRLADIGNIVHANDANGLAVVTQIRPISVVFSIPEQDLEKINKELIVGGKQPPLAVFAIDRDNEKVLDQGELTALDNQIDEASGTIKLKATFGNAHLVLWPGQFINARLLAATHRQALAVPIAAVQQGPKGDFVYVVRADLTAEVRPIKLDSTQAGSALIAEGLAAGEQVVVDGQYLLSANARVQLKSP